MAESARRPLTVRRPRAGPSPADPGGQALLDKPNHAVVSTLADDGTIHGTVVGVDVQDGRLAQKYRGADEYPFHQPGEQRITFLVDADRVRHQKQR